MDPIYIVAIIFGVALLIVLFICLNNKRYKKFVSKHSFALKQLYEINNRYHFLKVPLTEITYNYDHNVNFNNVSCSDYLIGYMNENMSDFVNALDDARSNREFYVLYKEEVLKIDRKKGFDFEPKLLRQKRIKKLESKIFDNNLLTPIIYFDVRVVLRHINMGGTFCGQKYDYIKEEEIIRYLNGLKNRSGYYYNDDFIWGALTRYERGKVSLKLRFSIYERDNYCCKKCGKHGYKSELEIDHIVPISRGGKTTYDNLQTLCHDCNYSKGKNTAKY